MYHKFKTMIYNITKRVFDFLLSFGIIIFILPLLLIISLLIKLDSKGPVFFIQKRVGVKRTYFKIYKFRTMTHRNLNLVDQNKEKVVTDNNDNRITKMGKLLRITSLDETPQLLNILKGEMSFVGPRPIIHEQLQVIPYWFKERFSVKPGITGLSQVRGRRSLSWEEKLKYDVIYARKKSMFFDIKIFLETFIVVFTHKGIYGDESKNWRAYLGKWSDKSMQY